MGANMALLHGQGAEVCLVVLLFLIPCTSFNVETVLIWLGRGVSSAFFPSIYVCKCQRYLEILFGYLAIAIYINT